MAKPIGKTPVFEGEDAIAILKKMKEPPTKKDKDLLYELYNDQKMKRIEKKYKPYKASNDSKNDNEERW